ncbi:hypothetical protein F5Y19DRAFT_478166 [Xylariaceae sp. FL1651]|nr:hypothetical protein F5Y19DRAFT_478166 [Xylariaceae sp. FL1651]
MADTPNASLLDPIEVGLQQPPANREAEAYCATVIANLEGWKDIALPQSMEGLQPTTEQLDMRTRRLEILQKINPPPPMDMPSWDSLSWRVARLSSKMAGQGLNFPKPNPPHFTPSLGLLRSCVGSIWGMGPKSLYTFLEDEGELDEEDILCCTAQWLCHLAGQRFYKIVGSFDLRANCLFALDMSLEMDGRVGMLGPQGHQMVMRQPGDGLRRGAMGMPTAWAAKKACCGCCVCSCHSDSIGKTPVIPEVVKVRPMKKRSGRYGMKARVARVFRKLIFWRRHKSDTSDSDSSSITTSSTCLD